MSPSLVEKLRAAALAGEWTVRSLKHYLGIAAGHALGVLLLAAFPPDAASAIRCGGSLVSEGDRPYDLIAVCGAPDYKEEIPGTFVAGIGPIDNEERWYYNFGPREFIRQARIRNGRIVSIDTLGYGFSPSIQGRCDADALRSRMSGFELITRCGEPVYKDRRIRVLPSRYPYVNVVVIDEWTYDFGPGRFVRIVTLVDGEVEDVETGRRR